MNEIAARSMTEVTQPFRLGIGNLHRNLLKLAINLCPFPRMHFYKTSFVQIWPGEKSTGYGFIEKLLAEENSLVDI